MVGRRPGVRRVALALLDRQAVLDLLFLRVIEPHAEHVGVGELIDALVELAEDRVEVERRGDLAADFAEQLDVLLAFALRPRQRLGRLRRAASLPQSARARVPCRRARRRCSRSTAVRCQGQQRDVAAVGQPRAIPGRQDRERVDGLVADGAGDAAGADAEAVVAEAQVGEVAPGLAGPRRPFGLEAVEPGLVLGDRLVHVAGRGKLDAQGVGGRVELQRRGIGGAAAEQQAVVVAP